MFSIGEETKAKRIACPAQRQDMIQLLIVTGPDFCRTRYIQFMNVFIVDDASFIRILCRHYVQKAGYSVVGEAYDGLLALEDISLKQPDCVIMDLALPGMNGIEIIKSINKDYPQIQFIIISALDEAFCAESLSDIHYVEFLTKPFDVKQINQALHQAEKNMEKRKHG